MNINDKKKHTTVRELAIGGGIVVLTSPIIIVALMSAFAAVIIGGIFMFNSEAELRSTFIRLFALNATIFVTIVWVLWRMLQRTAFLTHRLWGLNRENKRIDTLSSIKTSESRLSLDKMDAELDFESMDDTNLRQQQS